jgi:hypothetical protein
VRRLLTGEQLQRMSERGLKDREAVPAAARRSGQVDDERPASNSGDPARQEAMRRLRDRVGADRLSDPGREPLQHRRRSLWSDVARAKPRAACRQDEPRLAGELLDRFGNCVTLVGDNSAHDVEALAAQQLVEQVAARVLAFAHVDAVGDRQHRSLHAGSVGSEWTQ